MFDDKLIKNLARYQGEIGRLRELYVTRPELRENPEFWEYAGKIFNRVDGINPIP